MITRKRLIVAISLLLVALLGVGLAWQITSVNKRWPAATAHLVEPGTQLVFNGLGITALDAELLNGGQLRERIKSTKARSDLTEEGIRVLVATVEVVNDTDSPQVFPLEGFSLVSGAWSAVPDRDLMRMLAPGQGVDPTVAPRARQVITMAAPLRSDAFSVDAWRHLDQREFVVSSRGYPDSYQFLLPKAG